MAAFALLLALGGTAWLAFAPGDTDGAIGPTARERELRLVPLADVHPWGANFFLEREVENWKQELTVEMAQRAGLRWAKQHLLWSEVEQQPGIFDWSKYDRIVDLFLDAGIEVSFRVDWPPQWAAADFNAGANNLPRDPDEYARFLAAAVGHFDGRVRFFQVWNEPNLSSEWGWRPVDPTAYVDLLRASAAAARGVSHDVVILAAPLAINNESLALHGNLSDLEYLRAMYEAGAAPHFDVLAANAFGMELPPDDSPGPTTLNMRRIELQRDIMERAGDDAKPIWLSEYGWNAAPEWVDDAIWGRVDQDMQAQWTVDGVHYAESEWPWAGVFAVWYFRRERFRRDFADSYFEMVSVDFVARRVFDAVQQDATTPERNVATAGFWQERSSPVRLERREDWRWRTMDGATDRQALVAAESDAALHLTFRGDAVHARLRHGPQAGSVRASIDGRELEPLSLKAAESDWSEVPIVTGLGGGEHELRIEPGRAGGELAIDYWRVVGGDAADSRVLWLRGLAVVSALLGLLLAIDVGRAIRRVRI